MDRRDFMKQVATTTVAMALPTVGVALPPADVGKIAKSHGGGGHRNASGFST